MCNTSRILLTIINSNGRQFYLPSPNKIMKVLIIYLLSLSFFASVGSHIANNIKENLETRTEKLDSVLSSYSVYLQNN